VRATLIYQGRSTVELAENTKLVLKGDGIFLGEGRIAAAIHGLPAGSFRVETPHARIAHLGTEFTVDVGNGSTRIEVSSGRVTLSVERAEDKVLTPGQFALVSGDGEITTGVTGVTESGPALPPHEVPENVDVTFGS
jgi:ferric-dicitrate binding protein FerR (iron transport regulator)